MELKMGRLIYYFLIILVILSGCSKKDNHNVLIVGMEMSYPPFEMTDESGNPIGISVDLAKEIGKKLDKEVQLVNMSFDGLIPALKSKKIDIILSSMTATEERAKTISFSDSYLKTGLCILTGKDSNINSIENLNQEGKIVVVKKGTTGHIYAKENLKKARLLVVDKESSAVMEVIQQNADAFIYDQMSTYKNWQENLSKTNAVLKPFTEESWAIGIRQEDNQLREAVNKALFELKNEGLFDRLGDNYLSEQKRVFKEMGYPFYF